MIAVVPTHFPISLCLNHIPGSFGALGGRGKSSKPRIYSGSTIHRLPLPERALPEHILRGGSSVPLLHVHD